MAAATIDKKPNIHCSQNESSALNKRPTNIGRPKNTIVNAIVNKSFIIKKAGF